MFLIFLPATAAFLKKLDSCYSVEKGKKIVLKCEVVDPNVQVKWLKNGQEIKPSAKYMLKSTNTCTLFVLSLHFYLTVFSVFLQHGNPHAYICLIIVLGCIKMRWT